MHSPIPQRPAGSVRYRVAVARFKVDVGLAAEVTARMGSSVPTGWEQVDDLFEHWLDHVWFEPVTKFAAMKSQRRPPGADPDAWCRQWLETGLGGTCWGQSVAFAAIIASAGVDAWIGLDRMIDIDGVDFHSHVVAEREGIPVMYDLIHATEGGLALVDGSMSKRGPITVGFEQVDGRLEKVVQAEGSPYRYHVLSTRLDRTDVAAFCDVSATHSGLRQDRFFARRLPGDSMIKARVATNGSALEITTRSGSGSDSSTATFDDIDAGFAALGWNDAAVATSEQAGIVRRVDGALRFTL